MSINNCRIIDFPKILDSRGGLTFIEEKKHIPFDIKRIYYLYDMPEGAERGGHAHYESTEVIIAISGSFNVILKYGKERKVFCLNERNKGLFVSAFVWHELDHFVPGSVCLALASDIYKEEDYIRSYHDYIKTIRVKK